MNRPGRRSRKDRGSALLETLVAGTVLLVSLTGIGALSVSGVQNSRSGTLALESGKVAEQYTDLFLARGYAQVSSLMTSPAGTVIFDQDVTSTSGHTVHVTVTATAYTAISNNVIRLQTDVFWVSSYGTQIQNSHVAYLSNPN